MSWIAENPELVLGLAGIFGTLAGTLIGAWVGLRVDGRGFRGRYSELGFDDTKDLPEGAQATFESPLKDVREARAALHDLACPDHIRLPEGHPLRALLDATEAT